MRTELVLDAKGIDSACEQANEFLTDSGLSRREIIAARLTFENVLLMWRQHYGDNVPVTIQMVKRYGKQRLMVSVRGKRFDPRTVDRSGEKYAPIARTMLETSGFIPTYSYRGGQNIVTLSRPRPPLSSLAQIGIAFVLGIVVALLGNFLLPAEGCAYALQTVVTPLSDVFMAMLSGLAGPLIFLTVAWGVCGIGDVTALGRSGKLLVKKFLGGNVLAVIFSCLICIPFFSLPVEGAQESGDFFGDLMQMVIGLLPTNIFKAFVDGNTSQLIILGVFVGIAALVLGNVCEGVRKAIEELNALAQFLMEQLCRFVPAFIFLMVLSQVWSGTFASLLTAWLPLLLAVVLIVVFFFLQLVYTSVRRHVSAKKLLMALRPAMMLGLTTGSSCAAFGSMVSGCQDDLGVDEEQTSFGVPMGMVLCQPPTIIMLVVLMLHSMQTFGLAAGVTWYVSMALMCFLYSMVAPPVPGGMLACFGLLFAKLGIPAEALAVATAFNVIIDYVMTGSRVGAIMLTVFDTGREIHSADQPKPEEA